MSQEEAFARIRLLRSPNVGPVSYRQLLRRFGTAEKAVEALPDLARRGGAAYRPAAPETIAEEISQVRRAKAKYLFHDQPDYPRLLRELDSAPPILTTSTSRCSRVGSVPNGRTGIAGAAVAGYARPRRGRGGRSV